MEEHEHYPDAHHDIYGKTLFGFWVYLLTDFILFATLFATFLVLKQNVDLLVSLPHVLVQSCLFLTCSFTVGMAGALAHRKEKGKALVLFGATWILGAVFLWMQVCQFSHLLNAGLSWKNSGFLSAFFSLVGTHAAHVFFALLWTIVLLIPLFREEIDGVHLRRLTCLRLFWQFLNVVWVFIFTIVYCGG